MGPRITKVTPFTVSLAILYRRFGAANERVTITSKKKKVGFHIVSQNEEVMYCSQEKSYGGELVTQIFMILGYLNLKFQFLQ